VVFRYTRAMNADSKPARIIPTLLLVIGWTLAANAAFVGLFLLGRYANWW
jgi:hypothetical protein